MAALSVLGYLLTFIYISIVMIFIKGWHRLKPYHSMKRDASTKVSILVAARNEAHHIGKTIQDLLDQNYPSTLIEIIIVNDHSTDETAAIVSSFETQGVKLINLNEDRPLNSYKKKAIQTAIAQSSGTLVITTDADCRMGREWLTTIVSCYEEHGFKMISSPVVYFDEKNLFEKCQSLEFSYLIGVGASTIGNGNPSTCNGANLAYERKAFDDVNGFKGIDDLASGDDELLLHKIVEKYGNQVGFLKNANAIVYTRAKPNLKEFIEQRKRWASKSTRYKNKRIVLLGVSVWLFNLSIIANVIFSVIFKSEMLVQVFVIQLFVKTMIEFLFLVGVMNFFKRNHLLVLQPLVSLLHVIYVVYIGIAGNSGKYNWKDRMVK